MIPSEKEIARLITAFVGVSLQYATDEPPEPEEWPIATIFNMDRAAHAIAEKLAEGVVAEQRYTIRHANYPDPAAARMICSYLTAFGDAGPGHEGEYIWLGNRRIGEDGKQYRVTVREEGDGQGVD